MDAPAGIRTRVADSKGQHTLDTIGLTGLYAIGDSILPGRVGPSTSAIRAFPLDGEEVAPFAKVLEELGELFP